MTPAVSCPTVSVKDIVKAVVLQLGERGGGGSDRALGVKGADLRGKKGGGKNIKVYKPSRMDPQLTIDFNGGNVKKMSKDLDRVGDGTETIDESLVSLDESDADASLKKKAEKTGIPFGILKQVFKRGVAAWRTGHRPGTNPTQWGHARVNSFATKSKGTWGGADKDLAAKVRG